MKKNDKAMLVSGLFSMFSGIVIDMSIWLIYIPDKLLINIIGWILIGLTVPVLFSSIFIFTYNLFDELFTKRGVS